MGSLLEQKSVTEAGKRTASLTSAARDRGRILPAGLRSRLLAGGACLGMLCLPAIAQHPPDTSTQPWQPSAAQRSAQTQAAEEDPRTSLEGDHLYTLPELIDLAEQHNPATRAAWFGARGEAARLGIARAELFPALAAVMMTDTTRSGVLFGPAFVRQTVGLYQPDLELNYLVLDFGARSARVVEARERVANANFSFNRTQLDVLFATAQRYYHLLDALGQRDAAAVNLRNAETVRDAVNARLNVGLSTLPDALEARAAAAQANFTLQAAVGEVDVARGDLRSLLGASPLGPLEVQPLQELSLPRQLDVDVHGQIERALAQRPELGAQVAERDAARAEIHSAHSAFLPELRFQGQGGEVRAYGRQNQLPDTYAGPIEEWNATLNLRWELFEGGRRTAALAQAHADEKRAQAAIDQTRDDVEQQVYSAYIALRTAFFQRDAAAALLSAAQASYNAALRSYQLGVRNTVDVVTAQRTLAQALSSDVTARTDVLTQLANLAYRTGDLLQSASRKAHR